MLRTRLLLGVFAVAAFGLPILQRVAAGQSCRLFQRSDSNADNSVNITDAVALLEFLFLGRSDVIPCENAADSNDDGALNISDAVYTLRFLFLGASAPPAPFGECGADPAPRASLCTERRHAVFQAHSRAPRKAGCKPGWNHERGSASCPSALCLRVDSRHTYATEMLRCGMSLPVLMRILGHRTIGMTLIYSQVTQNDVQRAYLATVELTKERYQFPEPPMLGSSPTQTPITAASTITLLHTAASQVETFRRNQENPLAKKKLQRLVERLRRAAQTFARIPL